MFTLRQLLKHIIIKTVTMFSEYINAQILINSILCHNDIMQSVISKDGMQNHNFG